MWKVTGLIPGSVHFTPLRCVGDLCDCGCGVLRRGGSELKGGGM